MFFDVLDGRNDRPCCLKAGIPEGICLDFCEPPLEHVLSDYISCAIHAERIIKCGLEGVCKLPGICNKFDKNKLFSFCICFSNVTWKTKKPKS